MFDLMNMLHPSYPDQVSIIYLLRVPNIRTSTVFPHIRPAGINFSLGLQVRVLLEITKFHLHKSVPTAGIIRVAGIIRGRALFHVIYMNTRT